VDSSNRSSTCTYVYYVLNTGTITISYSTGSNAVGCATTYLYICKYCDIYQEGIYALMVCIKALLFTIAVLLLAAGVVTTQQTKISMV
jgi:hypothetical protein